MIEVINLVYQYPGSIRLVFPNLGIPAGGTFLLLGQSGSGKTTLLHLICGLLKSQEGKINIGEIEIAPMSERERDRFRGQHMGFIFQKNHLIEALTVKQNLMMPSYLSNQRIDQDEIKHMLTRLGIIEKMNSKLKSLSQGQLQRVAIGRALIGKPKYIFADEPTSALDDKNCDRVINLLLELSNENKSTLVIATHDKRLKDIIPNHVLL